MCVLVYATLWGPNVPTRIVKPDIFYIYIYIVNPTLSLYESVTMHTGFPVRGRFRCTFTFTFMHLADAFIQSDLKCIQAIHFLSVCIGLGVEKYSLVSISISNRASKVIEVYGKSPQFTETNVCVCDYEASYDRGVWGRKVGGLSNSGGTERM